MTLKDGEKLSIWKGYYDYNGATALTMRAANGEPYSNLTVNLLDDDFIGEPYRLKEKEFFVRSTEYNRDFLDAALLCGLFEDTGRRVEYGRGVTGEVWRFKN